jgi:hypothetical protein
MPRAKSSNNTRGYAAAIEYAYNDAAGASKAINMLGHLVPLGAANTVQSPGQGRTIAFFNSNASTVRWVRFGNNTVTAPTGYADGVPLPPGEYTILGLGPNTSYIANNADVFAYEVVDETFLNNAQA